MLHSVYGRVPPLYDKHIGVNKFSGRTDINNPGKRRKIHHNKFVLLSQLVEDLLQFPLERMEGGSGGPVLRIAGTNAIWVD